MPHSHLLGDTKKILLATDCSHFSDGALQESIFFAQACGAELYILHAIEANPEYDSLAHDEVLAREKEIKDYIEKAKIMAENEGIKTHVIIRRTDAIDKTIIEEASTNNIDVILMGRRGRRGLKKLFMGAVTERVLSNSPCKVFVVPKDFLIKGENILLALDGSEYSNRAKQEALSMVKRCDFLKNIIVVSVAKSNSELEEAQRIVDQAKTEILNSNPKVNVITISRVGRPYKVILEEAVSRNVDIIIMGKYGRSALEAFFIGSTTEEVIAMAPCSVLVVK